MNEDGGAIGSPINRVDPRFALFESGVVIAPGLVARRYAFLAGPVRILLG